MNERELVIIGDSRIRDFYPKGEKYKERRVKVITKNGAKMEDVKEILEQEKEVKNETLILVVGFFCDLTYLSVLPEGTYNGLCKAKTNIEYSELILNVTYWTRRLEREKGIKIIWTIPYTPNILRYNRNRVYMYNWEPMSGREERECVETCKMLHKYCDELKNRLIAAAVRTLDLRFQRDVEMGVKHSRDGLHMTGDWKQNFFQGVLEKAQELANVVSAKPNHVIRDKLITPNRRKYNREKRRRNRLNKRLRKEDIKIVASTIINKHTRTEIQEFLQ